MNTIEGTYASHKGSTITLAHDDGTQTDHALSPAGVRITLNGKFATVGDLQEGDRVSLTGDPATSVTATR